MFKKMLVLIVSTLLATVASAADIFATLDTNQNGAISKEEAAALPSLIEQWSTLDTDASGDLNAKEFAVYQASSGSTPETSPMEDAPRSTGR